MKEHLAIVADIYSLAFWPLLFVGFFISKDANVRWTLAIFAVLNMVGYIISLAVKPLGGMYGWIYHVAMIISALLVVKVIVIFRPLISKKVGPYLGKIPVIGHALSCLLPDTYPAKIYPEELAISRLYMGYVFTHTLVLCHYGFYAVGAFEPGGLYQRIGLYKRALFDAAYAVHLIIMLLELLLLSALIVKGLRARLVLRA